MKKVSMISLGLFLAAAQVNAAEASDGTINFDGEIAKQTCTVSVNGGSNSGTVTLPTVAEGMLSAAAQTAGRTRFTIGLTGCTGEDGDVYAYFEQGANVNADGRLKNTGDAQNVELQLLDANDKEVIAGSATQRSKETAVVPMSGGSATLTYSAQYYATAAAKAGKVASSVTYSIEYL